ncbi:MAG: hemolysin family protein [Dokdonella sp.]
MLQNLVYLAAAFALVALNGFFVAAEFALVKLRRTQSIALAANNGWRGRVLGNVHGHLDTYLSACQLGITLASLALGWIGEPAFALLLNPLFTLIGGVSDETRHGISIAVAFFIISFLHIVLGELAPKSLAIRMPSRVSLWTAAPLYAFYWLMYPAIRLLNASANAMLELAGLGERDPHGDQHFSRDEIKLILHSKRAARGGDEFTMMSHALELPELVAGDLLRTRDQLVALHDGMSREQVLAEFRRSRYSRYPWFDAEMETVRGILHAKDLLHAFADHKVVDAPTAGESDTDSNDTRVMEALLRPAVVVPLETPVLDIMRRFRKGQTHMALGIEDSGRVVGFFTLEDVIEIIVGDIEDEHRRSSTDAPQRAADGSFSISGGLPIFRLERLLGLDIDSPDDINSVGGLIIHRLERLPSEGETLEFEDFDLTVRTMRGARAQAITVHPRLPSSD